MFEQFLWEFFHFSLQILDHIYRYVEDKKKWRLVSRSWYEVASRRTKTYKFKAIKDTEAKSINSFLSSLRKDSLDVHFSSAIMSRFQVSRFAEKISTLRLTNCAHISAFQVAINNMKNLKYLFVEKVIDLKYDLHFDRANACRAAVQRFFQLVRLASNIEEAHLALQYGEEYRRTRPHYGIGFPEAWFHHLDMTEEIQKIIHTLNETTAKSITLPPTYIAIDIGECWTPHAWSGSRTGTLKAKKIIPQ